MHKNSTVLISTSSKFVAIAMLAALPIAALAADGGTAPASSSTPAKTGPPSDADVLLDFFQKKGLISNKDVEEAHEALASRTNAAPNISPWKISNTIKSIELFGDVRLRYEYRGVDNALGASPSTYQRERFRYAVRVGIRGELVDNFNYGLRLDTANNPRSPWSTFGNNTTAGNDTPSDKNASGVYLGQFYLGWHPTSWYEMTAGRMPMPLYTTPMVWDSDINPEGAFEKFKYSSGKVDWFAGFGQFAYQDPTQADKLPSSDTFLLAWQLGAKINIDQDRFLKIAPVFYNYTGKGQTANGLALPFVGQGDPAGNNPGVPGASAANLAAYNQNGIDNLLIFEVPAEYDFKIKHTPLGPLQARVFGDFSYNLDGDGRARAAYNANPAAFPNVGSAATGEDKAFMVGFGIGSDGGVYGPTQGLVYGSYSRKHAWEARTYYQYIEQYALDPNLIDSDFFEGRGNLQGVYFAFAYGITDAIIGTLRLGYADRIRNDLGTGGNNLDIPSLNPIKHYEILQLDLTCRF
jgi:hypothetical protein